METLDIKTIIISTLFIANILTGVANFFGQNIEATMAHSMIYENITYTGYNLTALNETAEAALSNPTIEGVKNLFLCIKAALFGIPDMVGRLMTIAQAPDGLITIVTGGLGIIFLFIYGLYLIDVISWFRGG